MPHLKPLLIAHSQYFLGHLLLHGRLHGLPRNGLELGKVFRVEERQNLVGDDRSSKPTTTTAAVPQLFVLLFLVPFAKTGHDVFDFSLERRRHTRGQVREAQQLPVLFLVHHVSSSPMARLEQVVNIGSHLVHSFMLCCSFVQRHKSKFFYDYKMKKKQPDRKKGFVARCN